MSRESSKEGLLNEVETVRERVATTLSTATVTLTREEHANRWIPLASPAAAMTVTLPAAKGTGDIYEFFVTAARTSGSLIIAALETVVSNTITGTVHIGGAGSAADEAIFHVVDGGKLTLNNTTTGGLGGDYLKFVDVADKKWHCIGHLLGSGSLATPWTTA